MRSSLTFWSRISRRAGALGIFGSVAGIAILYGCAGSNSNYDPNGPNPDGGTGGGGSDLLCVKQPQVDVPDDGFADTDCDGIDGTVSRAIFVATTGDDSNLGTRESPLKTIGAAISKAVANNAAASGNIVTDQILVAKGTYAESVTLQPGISIYGGYDAANLWARAAANGTTIASPTNIAVIANNIGKETHIELLTLASTTPATPGGSAYGVLVANSAGPLVLHADTINPADGAAGANGANGAAGVTGGSGNLNGNGGKGTDNNGNGAPGSAGPSSCGVPGGTGGTGGGGDGSNGIAGTLNPGSGGSGGGSHSCALPGNAGDGAGGGNGSNGNIGADGKAAAQFGTFAATGYVASAGTDGSAGAVGTAGGGGGAGGAATSFVCSSHNGPGGGGGGAGGCPGSIGKGGGSGGASVGIYVFASTVNVTNSQVNPGKGGDGGSGGASGAGAAGGAGGAGGAQGNGTGGGGAGGTGGKPGASGAGGGGAGGHSFGIWAPSPSVATYTGTIFVGRGAGMPGVGGVPGTLAGTTTLPQAPSGPAGVSADVRLQ